jgi:hypothetical protein
MDKNDPKVKAALYITRESSVSSSPAHPTNHIEKQTQLWYIKQQEK